MDGSWAKGIFVHFCPFFNVDKFKPPNVVLGNKFVNFRVRAYISVLVSNLNPKVDEETYILVSHGLKHMRELEEPGNRQHIRTVVHEYKVEHPCKVQGGYAGIVAHHAGQQRRSLLHKHGVERQQQLNHMRQASRL